MRADEVRAILAGRKTQFRRVVKWPLLSKSDGTKQRMLVEADAPLLVEILKENTRRHPHLQFRQLGAPGDRLWVRECWGVSADINPETGLADILFRADQVTKRVCRWRSSVHMPRWACRIILEVAGVRVERLNEISEEDAKSEWCSPLSERCRRTPVCGSDDWPEFHGTHRDNFRCWWGSIYGPEDWAENPWVRAVEFKVIEGGAK